MSVANYAHFADMKILEDNGLHAFEAYK